MLAPVSFTPGRIFIKKFGQILAQCDDVQNSQLSMLAQGQGYS